MTCHPLPGGPSNTTILMQMLCIDLQPSPPRAGLKPIHTFNLVQTERILTQRLIFW